MHKLFCALSIFFVGAVQASGTVDFLEVDNDVVLFSTSATKVAASPACVASETANLWTVSLASDSGRAIYSLILTSMAKGDGVALNIESAQDCADKTGVERASKVNVVASTQAPVEPTSGAKSIGLYKSDGVTRMGTVLGMGSTPDSWYYASTEGVSSTLYFQNEPAIPAVVYYFIDLDCTGAPFVQGSPTYPVKNPFYDNGRTYIKNGTMKSRSFKSNRHEFNGTCYNTSKSLSSIDIKLYENETCGNSLCVIKED